MMFVALAALDGALMAIDKNPAEGFRAIVWAIFTGVFLWLANFAAAEMILLAIVVANGIRISRWLLKS
jgi:hypothetical protein